MSLLKQEEVNKIKEQYPEGTRILLKNMEDAFKVPTGTMGTVKHVDDQGNILMDWDNGRTLSLLPEVDEFEVVQNEEDYIKVLVVEPRQKPRESWMKYSLKEMQNIVGGHIEEVYLSDEVVLVCNDEGKLQGLEANRRVGNDIIAGTFFLVRDDGSENLQSLTQEQVQEYSERFSDIEGISQADLNAINHFDFRIM